MNRLFDWLSRLVMLVLAGMVTLSIIGSIAAIPSGSLPSRIGFERAQQAEPPVGQEAAPPAASEPGSPPSAGQAGAGAGAAAASAATQPPRWLEAITYALIALAGIAALACVLLWRVLGEQRRIADALERISSR